MYVYMSTCVYVYVYMCIWAYANEPGAGASLKRFGQDSDKICETIGQHI